MAFDKYEQFQINKLVSTAQPAGDVTETYIGTGKTYGGMIITPVAVARDGGGEKDLQINTITLRIRHTADTTSLTLNDRLTIEGQEHGIVKIDRHTLYPVNMIITAEVIK